MTYENRVREGSNRIASKGIISLEVFVFVEVNLIVVTEAEAGLEEMVITDLVKLTDGIRLKALNCAFAIAYKIRRPVPRDERIGTIFMLGDSVEVHESRF